MALKNDPTYWGEEPLKMPVLTRVEPLGGEVGASEGLMPLNDDKLLTFIRGGSSHSLQQETLRLHCIFKTCTHKIMSHLGDQYIFPLLQSVFLLKAGQGCFVVVGSFVQKSKQAHSNKCKQAE